MAHPAGAHAAPPAPPAARAANAAAASAHGAAAAEYGAGAWPRAAFAGAVRWADFALLAVFYFGLGHALSANGLLNASLASAAPWLLGPLFAAALMRAAGAYRFDAYESVGRHAAMAGGGALAAAGLAALAALVSPAPAGGVLTAGVLGACAAALAHQGWRALFRYLSRSGRFARNVVIVGATPNAERLIETNARTGEVNVMAVFDDRAAGGRAPADIGGAPVLGSLDDLMAWPDLPRADCIIITVTSLAAERTRDLIERLRPLPNKIVLFLDLDSFQPEATNLARIADLPVAFVSGRPDGWARLAVKRAADLVTAGLALVVFAPVMAVVAIGVRLDSPGPVLFRQKRHGFNNSVIEVLKFRTMRADACDQPVRQVEQGDPRVTRFGRFLRKTSLDELPQIFNVLGGEMSMVGPRPHAIGMKTGEIESARLVADYAHRCRVKPGITGWAQVHGSRGPVHTAEDVARRVRYDIDYIQRQNLLLDLWILVCTIPCFLGDSLRTR